MTRSINKITIFDSENIEKKNFDFNTITSFPFFFGDNDKKYVEFILLFIMIILNDVSDFYSVSISTSEMNRKQVSLHNHNWIKPISKNRLKSYKKNKFLNLNNTDYKIIKPMISNDLINYIEKIISDEKKLENKIFYSNLSIVYDFSCKKYF